MNTDSPDFEDRPPAPSRGGNNLIIWVLLGLVGVLGLMVLACGAALLLPAVQQARTAARMTTSRNNLKQIGLALHNYHDVHRVFPPSEIVDEQRKPRQGWTYSILPFVDQMDLYEQIDDHAAWNDPKNVPFSQTQIPVYLNPAISETMSGDGYPLIHYAGNSHLFQPNKSFKVADVTDGLATTLMVGEINEGFPPWAEPNNTRDPALGLNKGPDTFGSPYPRGVNFLMGDGSVNTISEEIDPQVLKALATPNGGEELQQNW
jgi:hypothetical protein